MRINLLAACALLPALAVFSQTVPDNMNSKIKYADGKALVRAMHDAYAPDKWYRYFTFSQQVEFYRHDSVVKRDVWHEAYAPGKLIIKFGTKDSKSGRVYRDFTVYSLEDGRETQKTPRVHELLLVGLDVYFNDPERTIRLLDSLGYDLSKIRRDKFDGRNVLVVGAEKNDEKSRQFWIDEERLYMHRIVFEQQGKTSDVIFGDYVKMDGNWIAKTITFKTDNKLALVERYFDIRFPKKINPDWFDPQKFSSVVLD